MEARIEPVVTERGFRALHELLVEYERSLPSDLRHGEEPRYEDVRQTYQSPGGAFLATFDGAYAGCVGVRMLDPKTAILQRLYVRAAHRGKGAARALCRAAITLARGSACERIVLDTDATQLRAAAALYRSLGFTECAPYWPVDYKCATFMELRLTEPA